MTKYFFGFAKYFCGFANTFLDLATILGFANSFRICKIIFVGSIILFRFVIVWGISQEPTLSLFSLPDIFIFGPRAQQSSQLELDLSLVTH